jgi:hypothetical protein
MKKSGVVRSGLLAGHDHFPPFPIKLNGNID